MIGDIVRKFIIFSILFLLICMSAASAATLQVGSTAKYHTIQSAVNAAKTGDIINVAYGTYPEQVIINKDVYLYGKSYPKLNGFECYAVDTISGFNIIKNEIGAGFGNGVIKNNKFYKCGISLSGQTCFYSVQNNVIDGGTISMHDMQSISISGNSISNSKIGLLITDSVMPSVTKNTFKNCKYAIYLDYFDHNPGRLSTFVGNKYIGNIVNIGWGDYISN